MTYPLDIECTVNGLGSEADCVEKAVDGALSCGQMVRAILDRI